MIKFKGVKIKERMRMNMKKQNSRQERKSESIKKMEGRGEQDEENSRKREVKKSVRI